MVYCKPRVNMESVTDPQDYNVGFLWEWERWHLRCGFMESNTSNWEWKPSQRDDMVLFLVLLMSKTFLSQSDSLVKVFHLLGWHCWWYHWSFWWVDLSWGRCICSCFWRWTRCHRKDRPILCHLSSVMFLLADVISISCIRSSPLW